MKKLSKAFSIILSVALMLSVIVMPARSETFAATPATTAPTTEAAPATGQCGEKVTYTLDDEGTLTISGTGEMYDHGRGTVSPFYNNKTIKNVVIEDGVTSIGDYTFYNCFNIESIQIPSSVTRMGECIFLYCGKIKSIEIPSGVTSIGERTFQCCTSLTSVNIPSGVTSISLGLFYYCTSLNSVELPDSIASIGRDAFFNTGICNNHSDGLIYLSNCLIGAKGTCPANVEIEDGTRVIADYALLSCDALESITIPSTVTNLGECSLCDCANLSSITVDEANVRYDSRNNCNAVIETAAKELIMGCKDSTIPSDVTSIGAWAFWRCDSLTGIEIPANVSSIGDSAFRACNGLTTFEIPSTITSIGESAFRECNGLTSIEIPSSITCINSYTFQECGNLTSVKIPSSVTYIGYDAFLEVTATIYCESEEWLEAMQGDYGGKLTWVYKAAFDTASVKVGSSLALQTTIAAADSIENPEIRFTVNGETNVSNGTFNDGKWSFELINITPNLMASTIKMEVLDGSDVVAEKEYCIMEYCDTLYSLTAEELGMSEAKKEKLNTLLADMLEYGAMTQKYTNDTSDGLANDLSWVAENKTVDFTAPSSDKDTTVSARDSYDKISTAGLALNDSIEMYFGLKATNATHVEIFDGTNTKTIKFASNMNGKTTTVHAAKLTATQLDTIYTISLKENDTILHQVTYSVNSYIASKCDGADKVLADLVKAIYNYGVSAKSYQNYNDTLS